MASLLKCYLLERMEVDLLSDCWNWKGSLAGYRYGVAVFKNRRIAAHRASFEVFKGQIPKGFNVCHKCDNTKCINPKHMFLGTQKDNVSDAVSKGRFIKGERVANSKLTTKDVIHIKELLLTGIAHKLIAEEFNVHKQTVGDIKRQRTWKHLN